MARAMVPQQIVGRSGGILLHPTSLPGRFGIGDLGPAANAWVRTLAGAGQTWWQFLPLGPPAEEDSPYKCFSAFAGNPMLISPELLIEDGLLEPAQLKGVSFPADRVNYARVVPWKTQLLCIVWERFLGGAASALRTDFEEFRRQESDWLDDFSFFMALREAHDCKPWLNWPRALKMRDPDALREASRALADEVGRHCFLQFLFFRQLESLRQSAHAQGVRFFGDLPIFVALDSADVWAHPHLFLLDSRRRPKVVAGVPPDYFSKTGQLWGNPHYDWPAMRRDGYAWWIARFRAALAQADLVRIDHFRGFAGFWAVPAHHVDARRGRWMQGPGIRLFQSVGRAIGGLPFVAEDLGYITPDVVALRDDLRLPGMKILQFAFGDGPSNTFLPHHYHPNAVVYTGTHDNDTTHAWYESLPAKQAAFVRRYVGCDGDRIVDELIRLAWSSVADRAIVPLQDVLNLGGAARMNVPGKAAGNWRWRATAQQVHPRRLERLAEMTEAYGRRALPVPTPPVAT